MVAFGRDPLKKVRKAKNKAARFAADATQNGDKIVTVRLWSRDPMLSGALDDAMELRGYRFQNRLSVTEVVYRRATKEIERERNIDAAAIYDAPALIVASADEISKPADSSWVRVTSDTIFIGRHAPTALPMKNVRGYCLEEKDVISISRYAGAIIVDATYGAHPAPVACIVDLHDDNEEYVPSMARVGEFIERMGQVGIKKVRMPLGVKVNII